MINFQALFKPTRMSLVRPLLVLMATLAGCGTTNTIFYPNERAIKAADSVIDDIFIRPVTPTSATTPVVAPAPSKSATGKQ